MKTINGINGLIPYQILTKLGQNYIFGKPGQYIPGDVIENADGWKQTIMKAMTIEEWEVK